MSQAKDQTKTTSADRAIVVAAAATAIAVGVGLAHDAVLRNLASQPSQPSQEQN